MTKGNVAAAVVCGGLAGAVTLWRRQASLQASHSLPPARERDGFWALETESDVFLRWLDHMMPFHAQYRPAARCCIRVFALPEDDFHSLPKGSEPDAARLIASWSGSLVQWQRKGRQALRKAVPRTWSGTYVTLVAQKRLARILA